MAGGGAGHWEIAPVYSRYEVVLGKMLDSKKVSGEHLAPYLRNIDVQWDRINVDDLPVMDFDPEDRIRFSLNEGELLVCEGGDIGRTAIWRGELSECYYQKAIHRVRPIRKTEYPRFFFYILWTLSKTRIIQVRFESKYHRPPDLCSTSTLSVSFPGFR